MRTAGHHPLAGFALVLALGIVGVSSALLVTVIGLVRSETEGAQRLLDRERARQLALLALDEAIVRLQENAGPDARITAPAGIDPADLRLTAVWKTGGSGAPPVRMVSSPPADTEAVGDAVVVGPASADVAGIVRAPFVKSESGRYGWWIGDEGAKAALAPPAPEPPEYGPWVSLEMRRRLRQQAAGEPRASEIDGASLENRAELRAITHRSQLSFLVRADGTPVGADLLRARFHDWTSGSEGLLVDTDAGGLRRDLSRHPEVLGGAFRAWADYTAYLEPTAAPAGPLPLPAYGDDPVRRRYSLIPASTAEGVTHGVSPVLTYFLLTFNVRTQGGSAAVRPLEVRMRWMMTLWNPFSAALIPENLRVEVTGLPADVDVVDEVSGATLAAIPLSSLFGDPVRINLPWDSAVPDPERQSWLPGRLHTWTSLENTTGTVPVGGYSSRFNSRNLSADGGQGVQRKGTDAAFDGDTVAFLRAPQPQVLGVRLLAARAGGDVALATFEAPGFAAFSTTPRKLSAGTYQFSYLFRLVESFDTPGDPGAWLGTPGLDLRDPTLGPAAYSPGANGNRPELYENYVAISAPDRLLDRAGNAMSYNEDVPLFELPRSPPVSIGALQHLPIDGVRAFAVGNPWSAGAAVGGIPVVSLADRFYFSGLTSGVERSPGAGLPNPALRDLGTPGDEPDGAASRTVIDGAFNINSLSAEAWAAVLRGAAFAPGEAFGYVNALPGTGTGADAPLAENLPTGAVFFRFPQSAQETARADSPTATSTYAASTNAPPAAPSVASSANTHLFRRGWREIPEASLQALAAEIVRRNATRRSQAGPWESLAEFITSGAVQEAIAAANLNAGVSEFSAQHLTQADILGPLFPRLAARSDTFLIRAQGEAVAPSGDVRARAWLEATVQRRPQFVDPADPPARSYTDLSDVNRRLGRRFVVIAFRWLAPGDI